MLNSNPLHLVFVFSMAVIPVTFTTVELSGQEKGDRVVVTANFETKFKQQAVGKVFEGGLHTIVATNGKWCMLSGVRGWLPLQYVMDLKMAENVFTKRVKDNPQDSIAYAHRGMIYNERQLFNQAIRDLDQSLSINRRNPVVWMHRGIIHKSIGKYVLAAKDMQEAIRLNPNLAIAHYNIGLVFYAMNDFQQAVKGFDKAIELDDKQALWFVSRGSAKLGLKDVPGARKDYQQAISINAKLSDAHVGLSNLALYENDDDEAFRQADIAVGIQPNNALALNARGWALFKQDKIDEAIADLSQAIRFAPRLAIAYGNRGVCHVKKNEFDRAISDHTQHVQLDSQNPVALSNRAVAWLGKGDFKRAKADFEAAEKIAPELDEVLNGHAWFLATCPDESFRDGELAVQKAKKACEASSFKDWYQLDTLATAFAEQGAFDEAVKWAEKALAVAPNNKQQICQEQLARFKRKEPFRSQVGKNAEHGITGSQ